jgi:hypothetical protein
MSMIVALFLFVALATAVKIGVRRVFRGPVTGERPGATGPHRGPTETHRGATGPGRVTAAPQRRASRQRGATGPRRASRR